MRLDLTRYRQPITPFARTFAPDEVAQEGDAYRIVAPVDLRMDVYKDRSRFRLAGTARTELELDCSRCLEPFREPFHGSFDLRYVPAESDAAGEREVAEDDLDTSVYRDDAIELDEMLREQLHLTLPMKPLCREDCAGLCPQCGTNLNAGACGCTAAWEDPRLAPLKGLS